MSSALFWQLFIIIICIAAISVYYVLRPKDIKQELILAMSISFIWVLLSGLYIYKEVNYVIFGLNIFTFVAWTCGLILLREIYEVLPKKHRLWVSSVIFIAGIIILEWIGYNLWHIQLTTSYSGFMGLALMHMPWYGQLYYLTIGPLYLLLTEKLKTK